MIKATGVRLLGVACVALALSACVTARPSQPTALLVRDLSAVAGCRFIETLHAPNGAANARLALTHPQNLAELARLGALHGGTHLYIVNEAAFWGGAQAAGSLYSCRTS